MRENKLVFSHLSKDLYEQNPMGYKQGRIETWEQMLDQGMIPQMWELPTEKGTVVFFSNCEDQVTLQKEREKLRVIRKHTLPNKHAFREELFKLAKESDERAYDLVVEEIEQILYEHARVNILKGDFYILIRTKERYVSAATMIRIVDEFKERQIAMNPELSTMRSNDFDGSWFVEYDVLGEEETKAKHTVERDWFDINDEDSVGRHLK